MIEVNAENNEIFLMNRNTCDNAMTKRSFVTSYVTLTSNFLLLELMFTNITLPPEPSTRTTNLELGTMRENTGAPH
jgi:hypothetical protein